MKTILAFVLLASMLLSGCQSAQVPAETETVFAETEAAIAATEEAAEETADGKTLLPLPDTTMESLDDATAAIAFGEGDFYRAENGLVMLRMQVYSYDKYDLVEVSQFQAGDTILLCGEEILAETVEQDEFGTILINGGLDNDGIDLITDDNGVFYARDYSDMKHWYLVGEAEYAVSDNFLYTDSSDLEQEPKTYSAEDFLNGNPDLDYMHFPQNTQVRLEKGEVAALERFYTP